MPKQGSYPMGSRTLANGDTLTGVVTGGTADVPIETLGEFFNQNPTFNGTAEFTGTVEIVNGSDVITLNNNNNNVLVVGGTGTSAAKSIALTNIGGFIASSDDNVSDGVAFKSDFINTAIFQGLNSSGTAGYDTNLTLYRPSGTNNSFLGVTMSANPAAEQHLWMGTDYANNRYVFTQTVTGTGAYLPTAFRNGQADAFVIGSGATPPTTFYGGGVVLAGTEGNQVTWTLGGQTWSWNMAPGGNMYLHDGTYNKFPLAVVPNSSASLTLGTTDVAIAGNLTVTGIGAMPTYSTSGASVTAPHTVIGTVTLVSGTATITLSGNAVFNSAASYVCTANDVTSAAPVKIVQNSGTSITFSGTGNDVIQFICVGK